MSAEAGRPHTPDPSPPLRVIDPDRPRGVTWLIDGHPVEHHIWTAEEVASMASPPPDARRHGGFWHALRVH